MSKRESTSISPYKLVMTERSSCPKCEKKVRLLTTFGPLTDPLARPSFYLCSCGWVGHVGVGEVLREGGA